MKTKAETVITVFQIIFQLINILIGLLVLTIGALRFASVAGNRLNASSGIDIILTSYLVLFGTFTVLCSFYVPKFIYPFIGFMCHFLTRGMFYVFLGGLVFTKIPINITAAALCWVFGIVYIILFFVPGFNACVPLINHCVPMFDKFSPVSAKGGGGSSKRQDELKQRLNDEEQ